MYRAEPRIREQTKQKITSEGITPVGPAALTPLKEFVMNNSKQQRATHLSVSQKKSADGFNKSLVRSLRLCQRVARQDINVRALARVA